MTASRSCRAFLAHQSQATAQARAAADAKEREALIGAFVKHTPVKIERGTLMQIIEARASPVCGCCVSLWRTRLRR